MDRPFIECISLGKQFKGRNHTIDALTDINLRIEKDEFIIIKGRSGSGKSTLLNLMGGLIKPTSGIVKIEDTVINELNNSKLSELLLNRIGIVFQSFNLLPTYSVFENVEVALAPRGHGIKQIRNFVMPYFERFQLIDKTDLLPEELSAGQQQKVALIRTLVKQPSVILADEPTGSVDAETAEEIIDHLKSLNREKSVTIIFATHGIVQDSIADRIVTLEDGRIKD